MKIHLKVRKINLIHKFDKNLEKMQFKVNGVLSVSRICNSHAVWKSIQSRNSRSHDLIDFVECQILAPCHYQMSSNYLESLGFWICWSSHQLIFENSVDRFTSLPFCSQTDFNLLMKMSNILTNISFSVNSFNYLTLKVY